MFAFAEDVFGVGAFEDSVEVFGEGLVVEVGEVGEDGKRCVFFVAVELFTD